MNGIADGRSGSFSTGTLDTKRPARPIRPRAFTPTSVFDETQVRGSSNGLSTDDYERRRLGGGSAPTPNGSSNSTYGKRQWIDKNPYRTLGG
jgi:hypothetical protein